MPRPHIYMGDVLRNAGRNREALSHYKKALEVYPDVLSGGDRLSIYNNMGAVYLAMEAWDESVISYENALQIDPDYTLAKAGLEGAKAMRAEGAKRLLYNGRSKDCSLLSKAGLMMLSVYWIVRPGCIHFHKPIVRLHRPMGVWVISRACALRTSQSLP